MDSDLYAHIRLHLPVKVLLLHVNHREMSLRLLLFEHFSSSICYLVRTSEHFSPPPAHKSLSYLLVACSAWLSFVMWLPISFSGVVKGFIVRACDKGIHSGLIMDRSGHAKQTPPRPFCLWLFLLWLCLLSSIIHILVWRWLKSVALCVSLGRCITLGLNIVLSQQIHAALSFAHLWAWEYRVVFVCHLFWRADLITFLFLMGLC